MNVTKSRQTAILLFMAMVTTSGLAGCSDAQPSTGNPTTIVMAGQTFAFDAASPVVAVSVDAGPASMHAIRLMPPLQKSSLALAWTDPPETWAAWTITKNHPLEPASSVISRPNSVTLAPGNLPLAGAAPTITETRGTDGWITIDVTSPDSDFLLVSTGPMTPSTLLIVAGGISVAEGDLNISALHDAYPNLRAQTTATLPSEWSVELADISTLAFPTSRYGRVMSTPGAGAFIGYDVAHDPLLPHQLGFDISTQWSATWHSMSISLGADVVVGNLEYAISGPGSEAPNGNEPWIRAPRITEGPGTLLHRAEGRSPISASLVLSATIQANGAFVNVESLAAEIHPMDLLAALESGNI